jgi:hypothetical protein
MQVIRGVWKERGGERQKENKEPDRDKRVGKEVRKDKSDCKTLVLLHAAVQRGK